MDQKLRAKVMERAKLRCEYCQLHQDDASLYSMHVEHIVPKQHGGLDIADNLCLACAECNWAKGTNMVGLLNGKFYPLFNPRKQHWNRHFAWDATTLVGKTPTGVVTIQVLDINKPSRVMLRENLLFEGKHSDF